MNTREENWSRTMLLKIMREKVVTETDMLKTIGYSNKASLTNRIHAAYKNLMRMGFPVVRRKLDVPAWASRANTCGSRERIDHRLVIYYLDELKGGFR